MATDGYYNNLLRFDRVNCGLDNPMSDLVQIEKGYTRWRMKDGSGEFQAKKTDGGGWYHIILSDGLRLRHLAKVVEELAKEVKSEASSL